MNALTMDQVDDVAGGVSWSQVGVGIAAVSLGVAIAATGGLAAIPIGVIAGAGLAGELGLAATSLSLAGLGGFTLGAGLQQ